MNVTTTYGGILLSLESNICQISIKYIDETYLKFHLMIISFMFLKKVASTVEFARTWGRMKANRSEEMNYEKVTRRKDNEKHRKNCETAIFKV